MRVSTRAEISKLHARLGVTMIYVTHDQAEAMTMGDRICVMKDGRIMQVAEPMEIYNNPANLFVAGFIGSPPMNFLRGTIQRDGSQLAFVENNDAARPIKIILNEKLATKATARLGQPIILGLRPEGILDAVNGAATAELRIEVAEPMGAETFLYLTSGAHTVIARVNPNHRFDLGQNLAVAFELAHAHLFDPATELAI